MKDWPFFLSRPIGRDCARPLTLPVPGSSSAIAPIALSLGGLTVEDTALLMAFCMRTSMLDLIVSPPRSSARWRSSTVAPSARAS